MLITTFVLTKKEPVTYLIAINSFTARVRDGLCKVTFNF